MMRCTSLIILAVILAAVLAAGAQAGDVRVGLGVGNAHFKENRNEGLKDDLYNLHALAGYDLMTIRKTILSLDAEISAPLAEGSTDYAGSWTLSTTALYGTARIGLERIYVGFKLGMLYERLSVENQKTVRSDDLGLALGAAMGVRPTPRLFCELGATLIDANISQLHVVIGLRP